MSVCTSGASGECVCRADSGFCWRWLLSVLFCFFLCTSAMLLWAPGAVRPLLKAASRLSVLRQCQGWLQGGRSRVSGVCGAAYTSRWMSPWFFESGLCFQSGNPGHFIRLVLLCFGCGPAVSWVRIFARLFQISRTTSVAFIP